jgi:hypothetical protein
MSLVQFQSITRSTCILITEGALDWKICSRKTGLTALHVAASCGQVECVSELLTEVPAGIKSERSLGDPSADVRLLY